MCDVTLVWLAASITVSIMLLYLAGFNWLYNKVCPSQPLEGFDIVVIPLVPLIMFATLFGLIFGVLEGIEAFLL